VWVLRRVVEDGDVGDTTKGQRMRASVSAPAMAKKPRRNFEFRVEQAASVGMDTAIYQTACNISAPRSPVRNI
jgi:hypothetical protein